MESRAAQVIRELELIGHPEGGWYRETFRSPRRVRVDGVERSALTTIHYLLDATEVSRWHRVPQDEGWALLEGGPLELMLFRPDGAAESALLTRAGDGGAPSFVVPAGVWQAACPRGGYALVTCTMGPGFEFADFTLLLDDAAAARELAAQRPEWARFL